MRKKVLIVDDDQSVLLLTEKILTAEGYNVLTLNSSKYALRTIKTEKPDLVILDIIMPSKDGYKLCEEIKAIFNNKIPIIMITSQPYEKDLIKDAHKDFGADDYLLKPFETKNLLLKIKRII